MSKKNQKEKKVLDGHKKVGSRFIPPMKQIPNMKSKSFVNQMLPELIWIGLVNDNIGYVRGARLIQKIFIAVDEVRAKETQGNFAYASCYGKLQAEEKNHLVEKLTLLGILDDLKTYLAPLIL